MIRFRLLFIFLAMGVARCFAQDGHSYSQRDLAENPEMVRNLYRGKEYFVPHLSMTGTVSFADLNFIEGCTVVYEGVAYPDVSLMYDILRDEVVVQDPELLINVCLVKPNVDRFFIQDYEFVHVREIGEGLVPGLYYKVYESADYTVYGVRRKQLQEYASGTTRERRILEDVRLFVKSKDSVLFVPIKGQRDFLRNFSSHRREINRYLRALGLRYKENPERFILTVLTFLEEQTTS